MKAVTQRITKTGGREATTRHIPPKLALAVGMPLIPPPKGWRWASLTDIARLESGHTPSRRHPEWWGGSIPWIGIKDARANDGACIDDTQEKTNERGIEHSAARVLPANTVCLSRTASVGYVVVMGRPMATSQDFVNWVCSDHLDHNFLKYIFIAEGDELLRFASGSVHQTIYFPEVKAFHVCLPQLPEQQRIVGILDEAFDGIATAKVNAEKNLQNARALFESHLQSIFTHRSKGWVQKTLENVCHQITDGKHGDCEEQDGSGFYFLSAKDIKGGTPNWEEARQITKRDFEETNRRTNLEPGDILITNSGTIGRMAIAPKDDRTTKTTFQKSVAILKPRKSEIDSKFAFYCLSSGLTRFVNLSAGAAQKNLLLRDLRNYQFSLPKSLDQQVEVARKLNNLSDETQRLESTYKQKLAALEALKKSLLHQAFSGQL